MLITYILIALIGFFQPADDTYPTDNSIKVIVHVPPGGGTDNMARLVLQYAGKVLKTDFVIENHKGAGGQVGYSVLARSHPDGYTIGTITTMSIVTHELTRKNVSYKIEEDFIPIARVVMDPSALFVLASDSISSFKELLEIAKDREKKINCAGTAYWGSDYVHLKRLENLSDVEFNYIPFDGVSEVRNMLLGGHVRIASGGLANFRSLIDAGKVKPLVVASEKRLHLFPDVPTYSELGYPLVTGSSRGFAFPKDTPKEYVDLLSNTILEVLKDPAFLVQAKKMGFKEFIAPLNSAEFKKLLLELRDVMSELVREN
ncbi:MAG: tripartite tricarboxylate transporter substrate binding protein [Melioribacteraceae bacterium]|nr:tripartite tricarboxylate transporter substrate binding protein [Melioribacteraceae bacterium]